MAICLHPVYKKDGSIVPCNKCYNCLAELRAQWVFRMHQELKDRPKAYFVTLTYSDENLPKFSAALTHISRYRKRGVKMFAVLKSDHVSKFLRNLQNNFRKFYDTNYLVRYYLTAEYGDGSQNFGEASERPHYHSIFFLPDIDSVDKDSFLGVISRCWPYGQIDIKYVTSAFINYIAKHQLKECQGNEYQKKFAPIFSRVSKYNGGIGINYILDPNVRFYYLNGGQKCVVLNGRKFRLPNSYSKKLFDKKTDSEYQRFIIKSQENYKLLLQSENLSEFDNATLKERFVIMNREKWCRYFSKKFTRNYVKQKSQIKNVKAKRGSD